jgi:glycerol-3-phosphate dehydrogenase
VCHRAADAVDMIVEVGKLHHAGDCRTLQVELMGKKGFTLVMYYCANGYYFVAGYSKLLQVRLIQEYRISAAVAERLSRAYGGRACEVLAIARELSLAQRKRDVTLNAGDVAEQQKNVVDEDDIMLEVLLAPGFPYIEAEIVFAVRYEHAVHAGKSYSTVVFADLCSFIWEMCRRGYTCQKDPFSVLK